MRIWDYNLPENWKPQTDEEWKWYLIRKINYGEFKGLKKEIVEKHFSDIKEDLDPGKRAMLENFLKTWN